MDDDLDLLHDPDGDGAPASGTRPWPLIAAVVIVALAAVAGLGWLGSTLVSNDAEVRPVGAASPTSAPVPTPVLPTPILSMVTPPPTRSAAAPSPTLRTTPPPTTMPAPSPTPVPTTPRPTVKPPTTPPGLVKVPDVVGQRLRSATATLRAAGFRVTVLGAAGAAPRPDLRRVTAQRPSAGTLAAPGSVVVLVLDSV